MRKRATARFLYGAGGMNEPISPPTAMDLSRRMEIPEIIATPRPVPIRAAAAEPVDWGIDKGPDPGQIADNRGAVGHGAEANGDAFESHRRTRATGGRRDTLDGDDASEEGSVLEIKHS